MRENRGRLLAALLTIARAWYAAGKPPAQVMVLGSFEDWAKTMGGILEHAGVVDSRTGRPAFLENLDAMYELADESTGQWETFLKTLLDIYGAEAFTTKDIAERLQNDKVLCDALPADLELNNKPDNFSRRIGKAFSKRTEKRYGERHLRLERDGEEKRATRWCVRYG